MTGVMMIITRTMQARRSFRASILPLRRERGPRDVAERRRVLAVDALQRRAQGCVFGAEACEVASEDGHQPLLDEQLVVFGVPLRPGLCEFALQPLTPRM